MKTDRRRDACHNAARAAVDAWITKGDAKTCQALRDVLHALTVVAGYSERKLPQKAHRPRKRKAGVAAISAPSPT